jgi:Icc-related predicted phosphoesterase
VLEFVYCTDLHGEVPKYETVLKYALEHDIKLIHLGADLLPKGSGLLNLQKSFVKGYLQEFHRRCGEAGIKVLSFFGNDDVYTRKRYYRKYADLLDETTYTQNGYEFRAYGFVPIYPFSLRTACKLDSPGWEYKDRPCDTMDVNDTGFFKVEDPDRYFLEKGTIAGDLEAIKGHDKLIMAIHTPPDGLDLDACMDGRRVGSRAVYDWALNQQPLYLLSGHIHESYMKTGVWKNKIGNTVVIQPGQSSFYTVLVHISDEGEKLVQL